jgi:hypothetical protein
VIEHVPAATATADEEEIVHTEVELEVSVTVNPLEAENVSAWLASPTVSALGVLNVIV